jgi:hypothetical protein
MWHFYPQRRLRRLLGAGLLFKSSDSPKMCELASENGSGTQTVCRGVRYTSIPQFPVPYWGNSMPAPILNGVIGQPLPTPDGRKVEPDLPCVPVRAHVGAGHKRFQTRRLT